MKKLNIGEVENLGQFVLVVSLLLNLDKPVIMTH